MDGIKNKIYPFGKSIELCKLLGFNDTIALLDLLNESPKQFKDLATSLDLSQPSLSRRLTMLQTLNIIKKEPFRFKSRDTHTYNITLRGERLIKFMSAIKITNTAIMLKNFNVFASALGAISLIR